jgi:hypothetical protein
MLRSYGLSFDPHTEESRVIAMCIDNPDCSPVEIDRCDTAQLQPAFLQTIGNNPFAKTATYSDCVAVLQRASQKRNSQSQPRNDSARLLLNE